MGLPVSKNPLITKWSTIFDILENKTEISDSELNQLAQSTGFTVSALYTMLGLDVTSKDNTVVKNVSQFTEDGPLLVRNPEDPTKYIINPNFNAGLEILFNGQELVDDKGKKVGKMITKIDLSGTVTAIGRGSGLVKIQVGDNMNSSGWNTTDGKGSNATVSDVATTKGRTPIVDSNANYSVGDWGTDDATPFTKSTSITYTSQKTTNNKPDGYVHLNDGENVWRVRVFGADATINNYNNNDVIPLSEATITDYVTINYSDKDLVAMQTIPLDEIKGTFYNPITGKGCSTGSVTPGSVYVTNSISSAVQSVMQLEANYPSAVGARIIRSFTINLAAIVPNGGRVMIVIELNGNVKTQTLFYLKGYTPSIADLNLTLDENNISYVYYSGVRYYDKDTKFLLKAPENSIINLNNQLGVHSTIAGVSGKTGQKIIVKDTSTKDGLSDTTLLFNDSIFTSGVATGVIGGNILLGSSTSWDNKCGFSKIFSLNTNVYSTEPSISLIPVNAFGVGSEKKSVFTTTEKKYLVNTYVNKSDDLVENFTSEKYRRRSTDLELWDDSNKQTSLLTSGNTDLQVIPGIGLCYPSKNYTGFIPSALNYSECSGERSFIRKFSKQGAHQILTLTVTHNKHLHASSGTDYLVAGKIRFEFSTDGSTWHNISYAKPQNETTQGTSDSSFEAGSTRFVFKAPDESGGFVNNFFYLRVKMTDNQDIIIKSITWNV